MLASHFQKKNTFVKNFWSTLFYSDCWYVQTIKLLCIMIYHLGLFGNAEKWTKEHHQTCFFELSRLLYLVYPAVL